MASKKSAGQKSTGQKSSGVITEKKEITKLKAEIQRLNEELEKAKAGSGQSPEFMHIISSDANKHGKEMQIKELTAEVDRLKSKTQKMADLKKEIKALTERNQELHDALSQKDHELTKQRKENGCDTCGSLKVIVQTHCEEETSKLKGMAGAQLRIHKPSLSDLSDPNRPSKLGERFCELYDDHWCEALEELLDTCTTEKEKGLTQQLLGIVCDAYRFCLERSDEFMDQINFTLKGIFSKELRSSEVVSKAIDKANNDYLKSFAEHVVHFLQQDFIKEARTKTIMGTATEAYTKECLYICWLMTVQDPKVIITTEAPEVFDYDRYRCYTWKGKHLDYVVWPAVYLYEGGPLLSKGIAQAKS